MSGTSTTMAGSHVTGATFRYATGPEDVISESGGIDDVSFTAEPGTVTVLCGPSGSGKSTALRLLNGLIPHFHRGRLSGGVRVGDLDVPASPLHAAAGSTATVFQNPRTQFFTPTVLGDLAFAPENLGVDPGVIRRRIADAAAATGIGPLLGRDLAGLSGGELQRVACACAMASGARTLLFDEPTSNLSPSGIRELRGIIARLKDDGNAIVVAEHRLHFLAGLADRVVLLRDGAVARTFTGDEFFGMPDAERRDAGLRRLGPPQASAPRGRRNPDAAAAGTDDGSGPTSGLVLRDVRFSYGHRRVLDIPHLAFPAGRVTALTGPNGAGKSTLARIACGLSSPEKGGTVEFDGAPASAKALRREGYMVMQDTGRQLFAESVAEEVTLGLPRHRRGTVDVPSVLAEFDLSGLGDRHPHSLSGGQRQRLVIASASVQDKRIHILDEPTSGVGLDHLTAIAGHMRGLADAGAVVIVITHDDELIDACADHVIDLSDPAINHAPAIPGSDPTNDCGASSAPEGTDHDS
ncbi:ABC transporter ATP-binding protein [Corynebacterium sp. NPDC060344]|uniref:ABC transporter ATP-binding protein n=1 Tax=Corynebacterium sp. NPDC060344 TaxID=3347101 RepID=UPI00364D6DF6